MAGLRETLYAAKPMSTSPMLNETLYGPASEINPTDYSNAAIANTGDFGRGLAASMQSALAGAQRYVGDDGDAAENAASAAAWAPEISSYKQVHGLSDAARYVAGKVGGAVPYLAVGGIGAGLGRAVIGGALGGELGGAAAFQPIMAGGEMQRMDNDPAAAGMSPLERRLRAEGSGALQSAIGAAVPAMMAGRLVTRAAAPSLRELPGAVVRGALASTAEQGAAGAGMDLVSQAGRASYDPNYQYDPEATEEAAVGNAAGMAPMGIAHSAVAHGLDAAEAGGLGVADVAEKGAGMVWDGTKYVAKKAARAGVDAVVPAVGKAYDAAGELKDIYDNAPGTFDQRATAVLGAGADMVQAGVEKLVAGAKESTDKFNAALDNVKAANAAKIDNVGDKLGVSGSDLIAHLTDIRDRITSDPQEQALRNDLLDGILATLQEPDSGVKLNDRQTKTVASAVNNYRTIMNDGEPDAAAASQRRAANTLLNALKQDQLDTLFDAVKHIIKPVETNKSHIGADGQQQLHYISQHMFDNTPAAKIIYSFANMYDLEPQETEKALKVAKWLQYARDTGGLDLRKDGKPNALAEAFKAYFIERFGEGAGSLYGYLKNANDADTPVLTVKTLIKQNLIGSSASGVKPVEPRDIIYRIEQHDAAAARMASGVRNEQDDTAREDIRDTNEVALKQWLHLHVKNPSQVLHAVRTMYDLSTNPKQRTEKEQDIARAGDQSKGSTVLGSDEYDANAEGADQVLTESGYQDDGRSEDQTAATIHAAGDWDIHDQDVPVTGHATARYPYQHGELGYLKREAETRHNHYVDVSQMNVLERAKHREEGHLDNEARQVVHRNTTDADRYATELDKEGINVGHYINALDAYNKARKNNTESRGAIDYLKQDHKLSADQAYKINDIYWARAQQDVLRHDGAEAFFTKFPHHYLMTRGKAAGHEQVESRDILKAQVKTPFKVESPENGRLVVTDAKTHEMHVLDLPTLMHLSLSKVRSRTEGETEGDYYDRNLESNPRYKDDLIQAYGNVLESLKSNKDYPLTDESAALLAKPTSNLKLTAEGVTWGDLNERKNTGELGPKDAEAVSKFVTLYPSKATIESREKGVLKGSINDRVNNPEGQPVSINAKALVAFMAKKVGVDMKKLTREAAITLFHKGIVELRKAGYTLPELVSEKTKQLHPLYDQLVIADRPHMTESEVDDGAPVRSKPRGEDGKIDQKAVIQLRQSDRTVNGKSRDQAPVLAGLHPEALAVARTESFIKVIEGEMRSREAHYAEHKIGKDVAARIEELNKKVAELGRKISTENSIDAQKKLRAELAEVHSERIAVTKAAEKKRDEPGVAKPTGAEIARLQRMLENDNVRGVRSRLEDMTDAQLEALHRNMSKVLADKRGENDEPFVADTDESGQRRGELLEAHKAATNREYYDIERSLKGESVTGKAGDVPATRDQMQKVFTKEKTETRKADLTTKTEVADPMLQSAIENWGRNERGVIATKVPDNALKAFYDAAMKVATPEAVANAGRIKARAEAIGIDIATGKYTDGRPLPEYDGIKTVASRTQKELREVGRRKVDRGTSKGFPEVMPGKTLDELLARKNGIRVGLGVKVDINKAGEITNVHWGKEAHYTTAEFVREFGSDALLAAQRNVAAVARGVSPAPADFRALSSLSRDSKKSHLKLPDGTVLDPKEVDAIRSWLDTAFGKDKVPVDIMGKDYNYGGETVPDKNTARGFMIRLAALAGGMTYSNAFHEGLHGLFTVLRTTESGRMAIEKVSKVLGSDLVKARVDKILDDLPLADKDRAMIREDMAKDPEEAAAYAFQLHQMGLLKLGPEGTGFMNRVKNFFKNLLQMTSKVENTEAFIKAFVTGELAKADFKPSALEAAFAEKHGDRIAHSINEAISPMREVMHSLFDSSTQALQRIDHPAAKALADLYQKRGENSGFVKRSTDKTHEFGGYVQKHFLNNHSADDLNKALAEALTGEPTSELAKKISTDLLQKINVYAGRDPEHIPTIWDYEKIRKNRDAYDAALKDFGVSDGKTTVSKSTLDILNDLGYTNYNSKETVDFEPKYQSEKAKWLMNDFQRFTHSFIVRSVRATEHARVFGKKGEVLTAMLDSIRQDKGDEAYFKAKQSVDGMEGRLGQNMNPTLRRTMQAALTIGNIVTLPLALFSASIDPMHLAARSNGLAGAAEAYGRGIASIPRSIGELFGGKYKGDAAEEVAVAIGAAEHASFLDPMGDIYTGDTTGGWAKKANDWFFKANMLDGWTRQMRVAAVSVGQKFILAHKAGNETPHSARFLEQLGLKPSDIQTHSDGTLKIFTHDGLTEAQSDKIKNALNTFVDESVVRPDATTNAVWMNDPRFMLLSHMKRFTYAFNDVVLARAAHEFGEGNTVPMAMLAASIPVILAADMGKHLLKMDYSAWMKDANFGDWLSLGMNRSGLNGKMQFGLDMLSDVQRGSSPFHSAMGPDIDLASKMLGEQPHGVAKEPNFMIGILDDIPLLARVAAARKANLK